LCVTAGKRSKEDFTAFGKVRFVTAFGKVRFIRFLLSAIFVLEYTNSVLEEYAMPETYQPTHKSGIRT